MMRYRVLAAALAIACCVLASQIVRASDWAPLYSTTDGIEVFRKEGGVDGLIAFRGIGVVNAPLPVVATVIFDAERRREWVAGLVESRIVRWEDRNTFIEHDHIEMPFFMSERDFVSKVTIRPDLRTAQFVFQFRATAEPSLPPAGHVRGEVIDMTFILTPVDQGRATRIDASFLGDPKGWIPKFLVNYFLEDWPKKTFRKLRSEVLKPGLAVDEHFAGHPKQETFERGR